MTTHGSDGAAAEPTAPGAPSQAMMWNGAAGAGWVAAADLMDRTLAPVGALLVDEVVARIAPDARVLDVGCGVGPTTRALATALPDARCVGADVSEAMIAAARAHPDTASSGAGFTLADAQTHDFTPDSFDAIVSRFGVMFFDDPVAAFTNLRRAASDDATLVAVVWRGPDENPFMTAGEQAARSIVTLPARDPSAPGPFGLADADRTRSILTDAGWDRIEIAARDVECTLPEADLHRYLTSVGPAAQLLHSLDEMTRTRLIDALLTAHRRFVDGDTVRYTAKVWLVTAHAA